MADNVDLFNVALMAFFRTVLEESRGRSIAEVCAAVQKKFDSYQDEYAAAPPEAVDGATQFLCTLRTGFLEAINNENYYVC